MTAIRRTISTVMVLAMLMAVTAVPAFAVPVASSTLTNGVMFAGQDHSFTITITNNGAEGSDLPLLGSPAGSDIDAFQFEVPSNYVPNSTTPVDPASIPQNWFVEYDAEINMVYGFVVDDSQPGAIPPSGSLSIKMLGAAAPASDDLSRNVPVFVSDDGGITLINAGVHTLATEILEVRSVTIVKPAGAVNSNPLEVTAAQDNLQVTTTIFNYGTEDRTADVDADGAIIAGVAGEFPILRGLNSVTIDADAADQTGTDTLTATVVTTTGSDADGFSGAIAVQAKFAASYVPDSLAPNPVRQGDAASFSYAVNKTGVQPATLDITLDVLLAGISTVANDVSIGGGSLQANITFPNVLVPETLDNDDYTVESRAVGVDNNGATIDVAIDPGLLTITNLLPYLNLTVTVPDSQVQDQPDAATNGDTVTVSGTITIGETADTATRCSDCTLVFASISGTTLTGDDADLTDDFTVTNGDVSYSGQFNYPTGATGATFTVQVETPAGNRLPSAALGIFEVDVDAPFLEDPIVTGGEAALGTRAATTGRDANGDFIDVFVSEPINASGATNLDWNVDDNNVTEVTYTPQANGATAVRLRLGNSLGDDETPNVSYAPFNLIATRAFDRVGLPLADQAVDVKDGIAPLAPVIDTVDGLGMQDSAFWTNSTAFNADVDPDGATSDDTTVTLSGLAVGNLLEIYFDAEGAAPGSGTLIFSGAATSSSQTFTLEDLPAVTASGALSARLKDSVQFGDFVSVPLEVDITPAQILSFTQNGNDVTVTFDEPVPFGRDAAFDWTVSADMNDGDGVRSRTVTTVTATSRTERLLTVSAASYDSSVGQPIAGVRYKLRAGLSDRYQDRAQNYSSNLEGLPAAP